MTRSYIYISLVISLFYSSLVFSQTQEIKLTNPNLKQVTFRYLNNEDGLSQNSVISMAQDSTGYLWIATRSSLDRYDGNTFKAYNKQFDATAKGRGKILGRVFVDRQDDLWIISSGCKLEKYQKKTDKFSRVFPNDSVVNLFQDSYSNMYFSMYNGNIVSVNAKTKDTTIIFKPTKKDLVVHHFLEVEEDLYFTTFKHIYKYNLKTQEYNTIYNQNSKRNHVLEKSKDGTIWLGTLGDGLYFKTKLDKDFQSANVINPKLPKDLYILSLHEDKYQRLWICTLKQGILLLDLRTNTIEKLKFQKGNLYALSDNEIFSLYEDSNGVIWLGTNVSGLAYYDEYLSKFNVLTAGQVPKDINVEVVLSITSDNEQRVFLGTTNGLTVSNKLTNEFKTLTDKNSPLLTSAIDALYYEDGDLWIGNGTVLKKKGGLTILKEDGGAEVYNKFSEVPLDINYINKIFKDSNGQMWLACDYGLVKFDRSLGVIEKYHYQIDDINSEPINAVSCIIEDNQKTLWVSTYSDGIYTVDLNSGKIEQKLKESKKIKSIAFDPVNKNILWIGTNGKGLIRYDIISNKKELFSTEEGLPDNCIYGILFDEHNTLWMSTNRGLVKFFYHDKDNVQIENFNTNDGLQSLEFNSNAYYKDDNGVMYFGGLSGVNWFKPETITKNPNRPKTIISKIKVLNNEIDFKSVHTFNSEKNSISFDFKSLSFSKPRGNNFKYRLINHDNEWIESGNNNVARYVNLPPNDYTFEVISSNYDGLWNNTPDTYSFTILQPWYLSNWAKAVYTMLFLLAVYGIYKYFSWRWQMKMKLELESRETARLKKLDEFKTKLYNNISHEFRTPLTLISGPVENQLCKPNISKNDKQELNLIKRSSKRLLNLVNQLLDLSKLETGNIKLLVTQGNLSVLLKQLATAFAFKAQQKNIEFTYSIENMEAAWFDKDLVEKIVSNLLNNAVKYTPENGYVKFDASVNQGYVTLTILNNGNNLKDEELPALFQRYYQNNTHSEGVGIGLSLVKELSVLSHGSVVAHSMNQDDIQFVVTLPIEKAYFNSTEISAIVLNEEDSNEPNTKEETSIQLNGKETKPLLLIVEDDEDIRAFVKSILKDTYKIIEACNGEKGIEKAVKHIPDIIISDVMMPKVDGIQLCNTLKEDIKTSHIPIILLTAKSGDHNEIEGLRTGADAYMTKPFNSEKLKIRVEKLITTRKKLQEFYGKNNVLDFHNIKASKTEEQFFKQLQEAIKEHIVQSDFTAETLSKSMHMSRMQLHRKLKALLGLTTSQFIRNERLKLAMSLLENSNYTISEIAYQTGFNSPSYFIKCFKEVYRYTPKEHLQNTEK
ncbi:hybrid sensor histidine kinase/response regulator transcription factor [Mangrovimonas spongiae]|uniref:histidine kinase n=1 Tax=Mangrovimonas spongiae TaxID=2494697 RepID=A0A428K1J6_9FLAO|nr:hybrid sensor histidine kinase/response regulator transcription factor [Mangrovimonas spongiae]RSK40258.1 hybrid sensor histidine kinase/response regulator [Mangrovimonas spongiae]